jgi:predicted PurR-regulated permease PerM
MDQTSKAGAASSSLINGVAAAFLALIIVTILYFGRELFVPIALAVLLSFVLAPLVRAMQRLHVPRALSVVSVVVLAFLVIFALGGLIATQLTQLAGELPRYQSTIHDKIISLRGTAAASSPLERAADMLQELGKELNKPRDLLARPAPGKEEKPIPVEIHQPPPTALESIAKLISPLLAPLATTGILIIFVIFILLQREDLRNRLIRLAGSHDLQKTTAALDDAASRLSRVFVTQLALNSAFGIVIGTGLWTIGVPSPLLWGILAAILRFVPYVGAFISAMFPLALAVAVDPGWFMLLWTVALFLIVEPLVGQVLEPLVYGHSTGLSPVAVVLSATFWTALWGPIGLVLATPLTVCLVVLGRHVERLEFLDVMFGDRPALSPPEIFYQRLLAGDPAEAVDNAEEFLKERSLADYYDQVALKGLKLAQNDIARGTIDFPQINRIKEAVDEVVDDLADQGDQKPVLAIREDTKTVTAIEPAAATTGCDFPVLAKEDLAAEWGSTAPILCAAGRNGLDEAASTMLAQLLGKHGLGAKVAGAEALSTAGIFRLDTAEIAMVCISYLDGSSSAHMRYTIRRLRRKLPQAKILLGCWMTEGDIESLRQTIKADAISTTLRDALKHCIEASIIPHEKDKMNVQKFKNEAATAA